MKIIRFPDIPRYIYTGRIGESYLEDFVGLYRSGVEVYPAGFFKSHEMRKMAVRIAYDFFRELGSQIRRDINNKVYIEVPFKYIGDQGFCWPVVTDVLSEQSTVLCAGVGGNMTFESRLALETGCKVHLFDPSIHAISHFEATYVGRRDLILNKRGLWGSTGTVRFFKDVDPRVGSLSAINLMNSDISFDLPVISVPDYLALIGRNRIDYLKMDIEGAEYEVIHNLLEQRIAIDQLSFEFDQPVPPWRSSRLISMLTFHNYMPVTFWGTNTYFISKGFAERNGYFRDLLEESG